MPSSSNVSYYIKDSLRPYQSFWYHRISSLHLKYGLLTYNSSLVLLCIKVFWPSGYPLNLFNMNNARLLRITATAGTYLVKTSIPIIIINTYLKLYFRRNNSISFTQIASSAVRPLTKIPHCCTYFALGFFQTQCDRSTFQLRLRDFKASEDITFTTTSLGDINLHPKAAL